MGRLSGLMALSLADASVLHYNTVLATQSLEGEVEKLSRDNNQFRNISKGKEFFLCDSCDILECISAGSIVHSFYFEI